MTSHNISVEGMSCGQCLKHVTRAVHSIPGVKAADVRVGSAYIQLEAGAAPETVLHAIRDAGYDARLDPQGAA
jgi:copper chaperone